MISANRRVCLTVYVTTLEPIEPIDLCAALNRTIKDGANLGPSVLGYLPIDQDVCVVCPIELG